MKSRTVTLSNGIVKELVPTTEWYAAFSWKNWRIGASFQTSIWEFDFLWFYVWCERYCAYGRTLYDPEF